VSKEALEAREARCTNAAELAALAQEAAAVDADYARALLERAEEQASSVGETKEVVAAAKEHLAEAADWIARMEEKLARSEANQARYAVFQAREKDASSSVKTLQLADAVMAELDDKCYARKLLADAQKQLEDEGWDFSRARKLVEGVSRHLGDSEWAARLLENAGERAQGLTDLNVVAETANQLLPDKKRAGELVKGLLDRFEQGLEFPSTYDLSKLAMARCQLLGDQEGAAATLDKAAEKGGSHFTFAELARLASELGLAETSQALIARADACCEGPAQARQLAGRLLQSGFSRDQVRTLYQGMRERFTSSSDRLAWADAIVDLFGDRAWAREELEQLATQAQGADAAAVKANLRRRAGDA
jgi:hypothetical protein